jgi:hypothetical protein
MRKAFGQKINASYCARQSSSSGAFQFADIVVHSPASSDGDS